MWRNTIDTYINPLQIYRGVPVNFRQPLELKDTLGINHQLNIVVL